MKKNRNLILIAVLVLLIAGGIYFLFKDDNKGMHAASSQGPSIEFHNSDMKETKDGDELHLKADRGRVDRSTKIIYIEGNVEGYGKEGEELYAENLTYDGNKDILSTDKAFVAKKDGKVLTADRFEADRVIQKITARGHAKLADEEGTK